MSPRWTGKAAEILPVWRGLFLVFKNLSGTLSWVVSRVVSVLPERARFDIQRFRFCCSLPLAQALGLDSGYCPNDMLRNAPHPAGALYLVQRSEAIGNHS